MNDLLKETTWKKSLEEHEKEFNKKKYLYSQCNNCAFWNESPTEPEESCSNVNPDVFKGNCLSYVKLRHKERI